MLPLYWIQCVTGSISAPQTGELLRQWNVAKGIAYVLLAAW